MADQPQEQGTSEQTKKKRGTFPRLPLSKILELPTKIYELGEGEEVRRLTVFDRLGKSPTSGSSKDLMGAANSGYGLITGSYLTDYLGLTDRGMQIVSSEDNVRKYEAIYEALFNNEIFSAFIGRFKDRSVPADEVAIDYLVKTHNLSQPEAHSCWNVFKDNISDFDLIQQLSGKKVIVSREVALENLGKSARQVPLPSEEVDISSQEIPVALPDNKAFRDENQAWSKSRYPTPQFHFNIQIVLPENSPPEIYDHIFKSIAIHLLKRDEE